MTRAFASWALLGSNQRPLPCKETSPQDWDARDLRKRRAEHTKPHPRLTAFAVVAEHFGSARGTNVGRFFPVGPVYLPGNLFPIYCGRSMSLAALADAPNSGRWLLLLSQRDAATTRPAPRAMRSHCSASPSPTPDRARR